MRHHSENVSIRITNSGNICPCSVRVRVRRYISIFFTVPKYDLIILFETMVRLVVACVVSLGMGNRQRKHVPGLQLVSKRRIIVLNSHIDVTADKMQIGIADQRSRQQTALAKYLKSIANSKY